MIGGKDIDGNHGVETKTANDFDVLEKVCASHAHFLNIFFQHCLGKGLSRGKCVVTRVRLERANSRDDHCTIGTQATEWALDVEETFGAHICAKSCFGHNKVAVLAGKKVCDHRGTARRNISKRTGVHQNGASLGGAQKIRAQRITQKRRHRARGLEVLCGDVFAGLVLANNDAAKALTQVTIRGRQGHDDHDFAGCSDIERSLASHTVDCTTQAGYDVAKRSIIDIKDARPCD